MTRTALLLTLALSFAPATHAERADRHQPVNIEADKLSVDDRNKVQIFEGRVKLTQGSMQLSANKIVVTQDADGFQKGIATGGDGGLARFRQKREGRNEFVEGEAERIEYDGRTERAQLFQRAFVKSGRDEVRGQYIEYDGLNEQYLASNGSNASTNPAANERIRVIIQPKPASASGPAAAPQSPPAPAR